MEKGDNAGYNKKNTAHPTHITVASLKSNFK